MEKATYSLSALKAVQGTHPKKPVEHTVKGRA